MTEGSGDSLGWATAPSAWLAIGRALLASDRPLIPAELARATHKDQSNLRREADAMVTAGLLEATPPPPDPGRTGRPPSKAYELLADREEELRIALEQRSTGALRRGQELVYAGATADRLEDLFTVLSESKEAAQAAWTGLCAGDAQEYLLVFDGPDPASPAVGLAALLSAAKIPCRRATVTQLKPTHELLEQAHETAREARRARMSHGTRHAS
jgi:hypothetical protein